MLDRRRLSTCVLALLVAALPVRLRAQCSSYSVSVTPKGGSADTVPANATDTVYFTVSNTGGYDCADGYQITVSGSGSVSNVSLAYPGDTLLIVEWQQAKQVGVTFGIGAGASGALYLTAQGYASDNGSINVASYPAGPPLDLLHAYIGPNRDVSKCVASCFDAVTSYATPPYYSTDAPQSIQLVYRSSLAHPRGYVSVFAWDTTAVHPIRMSLQLKRWDGTMMQFLNGSTEVFFSCDSTGGHSYCSASSEAWLAAQFDVSTYSTGAYPMTLVVRSYPDSSHFSETDAAITVLVENEVASPFGAGWTLAGYQRLHVRNDYSLVITDGSGSMGVFPLASHGCSTCTYTSPTGDFSTVTSGAADSLGAIYRRRYPDGTTVGFYADGRMDYVQDAHGNTHQWRYDVSNQVRALRDVAGKDDSLGYDFRGNLSWIKDPGGRVTSVAINTSGNLTQITDAVGGIPFQGVYDGAHRLIHRVDRGGGAWGLTYDFANKLQADTTPPITTANGPLQRMVTSYVSLEAALLSDTVHGTWSNPTRALTGFTARAKVTNPKGYTTAYVLDRFRQAAVIEQPLGRRTKAVFDSLGRRTMDSLFAGQWHRIFYTWTGPNITLWKDTLTGRTITYTYDTTYNLLTSVSGDVDSVINVLNSAKSQIDSTRVGGATSWARSTYAQDPYWYHSCTVTGVSIQYPAPNWNICTYPHASGFKNTDSVLTRGVPADSPATARTVYQYDAYGQRTATINPVGDTTSTLYDLLGRITKVIGPLHDVTQYFYDDSLHLTRVQDARGQVYTTSPNALGWPDSFTDPAGKITRFTYDSNGNQVTVTNRRSQVIQFMYDSLDQLQKRTVGTDTTIYFTDPLGRYKWVANRESVDTVKVDSAGRTVVQISCRVLIAGNAPACTADSSAYDTRDLRTKLVFVPDSLQWGNSTLTYHYNPAMLLDTLIGYAGDTMTFTYNPELRDSTRTFRALGNLTLTYHHALWVGGADQLVFSDTMLTRQIGQAYRYDTASRVTRYYHGNGATPDTVRSFVDSAGRLVAYVDSVFQWTAGACSLGIMGEKCDYSLVQTKDTVHAPVSVYYDSVGNRKDSPSQSYAVSPGNRLTQFANFRMKYDLDGNLSLKQTLNPLDTTKVLTTDSLWWSATGQLDSLHYANSTGNSVRVNFGYDGWGRRVRKFYPDFASSTVRWVWDGNNMLAQLDTLGRRSAYWTVHPATGEPLSVRATTTSNGDTTLYYVTDALHNVVARLKANGGTWLLYNTYRYGPFGDSLATTGTFGRGGQLQYKGAYYEQGSKFYLMGARYYDRDVGRFMSEDPLGLDAGINQYALAADDPVNGYDPSGEFAFLALIPFILDAVTVTAPAYVWSTAALLAGTAAEVTLMAGGAAWGLSEASAAGTVGTAGLTASSSTPCGNVLGGNRQFLRLGSGFGARGGVHQGVDILAAIGTHVTALAGGKVMAASFNPHGYGYEVIVGHSSASGTYYTEYAHLEANLAVHVGDPVSAGSVLGSVGNTGYGTGLGIPSHLHFEVRQMMRPGLGMQGHVDPSSFLCWE